MSDPVDEFGDLMIDTVSVYKRQTDSDFYRKPTFASSPVIYPARIEYRTTERRDATGQMVLSTARAFVLAADRAYPDITTEDRVMLPDGSTPPVLEVQRRSDNVGPYYAALYFA